MEKPGLIIPPKSLQPLINSTALAVAKNGVKLEELIYKNDENENKFSFLKLKSPYRRYYDSKVIENAKKLINPLKKNSETNKLLLKKKNLEIKENFEKDKKKEIFDFETNLKFGIKMEIDDVVKLTAEFVAVNGEEFLNKICFLKKNDPLFFFLKPNHELFQYFTVLVDSYIFLKDFKNIDFEKLNDFSKDRDSIVKFCEKKFEVQKIFQKKKKN